VVNLVLGVQGDDRAGLVDALAAAVAERRGNWERAQMTRLAGKFAGIVPSPCPPRRWMRCARLRAQVEDAVPGFLVDIDRGG